jgi:MiaB-like tRNA modifying enzyme
LLSKKIFFKTFGCRTNIFDTEVMVSNLTNSTAVNSEDEADTVVVNSCTVTNSADSNSRSYINSVRKRFPEKEILFTGCGVRVQGEKLFKNSSVKSVFGHSEKERVEEFINSSDRRFEIGDLNHLDRTVVEDFSSRSRAFIKVQEGCNFSCSYCIIPSVRGKSRNYSEDRILDQIRRLANNGYGEFVLTGTNIGSYRGLPKLLKSISQIRGVRRVRLGSVEPSQIDDEFREILKEEWLGRYLHIALQYTDDRMLKVMNRRNRLKSDLKLFDEVSSLGYAIGTDYIVGHPGESEEIFQSGLTALEKFPLTHIHLFRYSPRDGTPSAEMKPINGAIVKERFQKVDNLIKGKMERFRDSINRPLKVLFETEKDGVYQGNDQFFFPVYQKSGEDISGEWRTLEKYNWRNPYRD